MAASFKWSHVRTAALSAPNPTADPHLGQRLLDIYRQVWVSLLQGHWCTQGFVCALQESISSVQCKFWRPCGGANGDLLQEGLCRMLHDLSLLQSECLSLQQAAADPFLHRRHSNAQRRVWLSLCGTSASWCALFCLNPPSVSGGYGA